MQWLLAFFVGVSPFSSLIALDFRGSDSDHHQAGMEKHKKALQPFFIMNNLILSGLPTKGIDPWNCNHRIAPTIGGKSSQTF